MVYTHLVLFAGYMLKYVCSNLFQAAAPEQVPAPKEVRPNYNTRVCAHSFLFVFVFVFFLLDRNLHARINLFESVPGYDRRAASTIEGGIPHATIRIGLFMVISILF